MMPTEGLEKIAFLSMIGAIEAGAMAAGLHKHDLARFWDWLGNVRFKEWGGDLTSARASIILQDVDKLAHEWITR